MNSRFDLGAHANIAHCLYCDQSKLASDYLPNIMERRTTHPPTHHPYTYIHTYHSPVASRATLNWIFLYIYIYINYIMRKLHREFESGFYYYTAICVYIFIKIRNLHNVMLHMYVSNFTYFIKTFLFLRNLIFIPAVCIFSQTAYF